MRSIFIRLNSPKMFREYYFIFGTLLKKIFFFDDIKSILISLYDKNTQILIGYLFIATIPAVFLWIGLKDYLLGIFDNVKYVGLALIFTGCILVLSSKKIIIVGKKIPSFHL